MKSSRWLWGSISIIAVLSTCLFIFGLVYAILDILNPKPSEIADSAVIQAPPSPAVDKEQLRIVALGDSLTRGTGDQSGKGYVTHVKEKLESSTGKPVFVIGNLSVNGYTTDQLLADLNAKKAVVETLRQADIILLTIGGNDLFQLARDEMDLTTEIDPVKLREHLPDASLRLDHILTELHEINAEATIIYVGLFNPFLDLDETKESSLIIQQWNDRAFEITNRYPHMTLVPTFDLFEMNHLKYLYSDHFHPNQQGYERIAERVVQAIQ